MVKPEECPKRNQCSKVARVLDKDLPGDIFYAVLIREVCAKCEEGRDVQMLSAAGSL